MPELPDVEIFKQYAEPCLLFRPVEYIEVVDPHILNISKAHLKWFEGKEFTRAYRQGKYVFWGLDQQHWLVMHFGMTGNIYFGKQERPQYSRLLFHFTSGTFLAFINPRKLGRIDYTESIDQFCATKQLGPDALDFSLQGFVREIEQHKGQLKSFLMNQKYIAGIGNIYADEILFQSRLHPAQPIERLNFEHFRTLFAMMKRVLRTAIYFHADPGALPAHYMLPKRKASGVCPRCTHQLTKIKFGGRGTYLCPSCQILI